MDRWVGHGYLSIHQYLAGLFYKARRGSYNKFAGADHYFIETSAAVQRYAEFGAVNLIFLKFKNLLRLDKYKDYDEHDYYFTKNVALWVRISAVRPRSSLLMRVFSCSE